ncbi:rRNA pseudouridine synthase [Mariniblastus sp.]|nr:rRNA pseudouridine synthase [Mariniblastus sp.]
MVRRICALEEVITMAKKKSSGKSTARPKASGRGKPSTQRKPAKKSGSTAKSSKPKDSRLRLQRVMASAGVGSRRECELIIEEGRVEIDGQVVTTLGVKVDPNKQEIYVDAEKLTVQRLQYFILNKPPGILSTSSDPSGRPRVIDLIKTDKRVYNVGRLDQSSEGLILVTNDGELANQLTHPSYGVEKKYHVQVVGIPAAGDLRKLEEGVYIAEGLARATKAKFLKRATGGCWLEIVLAEGRNREIRRMLAGIGHKVRTLKRVSIGPLRLGDLPRGAHRALTSAEIKLLKKAPSSEPLKKRRRPVKRKKMKVSSEDGETEKKAVGRRGAGKASSRTSGGKKTVVRGARKASPKKDARGAKGASKKKTNSKKPRRGGFDAKPKRTR